MTPGGAEVGPIGMPDGRADEGAVPPFGAPREQLVTDNRPAAAMTARAAHTTRGR